MTQTRWAIDGPDGTSLELSGRRFSSNDEGAPMMCNLVCSSMGRHPHIAHCRAEEDGHCNGEEIQHINEQMTPNPDKAKDFITHRLYWRRMGASAISLLWQVVTRRYFQASKVIGSFPLPNQPLKVTIRPIYA
jgi:hypothetical protein